MIPGWKIEKTQHPFPAIVLQRIKEHARNKGQIISICAGSLVLVHQGLLSGVKATTTNQEVIDELKRHKKVQVVEHVLHTCTR